MYFQGTKVLANNLVLIFPKVITQHLKLEQNDFLMKNKRKKQGQHTLLPVTLMFFTDTLDNHLGIND